MVGQVRIALALRNDAFKIALTGEMEQSLPVLLDVIAEQETLGAVRHNLTKPKFPICQWQIADVFAVAKPPRLCLIVRPHVLVPQDIECVEKRLGTMKQQITKLRLAIRVQANDLAIEHTPATFEIAS
jgi:hypothetical protein